MLSEEELLYTLALQRVANLGDTSAKKLIHHTGSARAVFRERKQNLLKIDGIGNLRLKGLNERMLLPQAEEELKFIHSNNVSCCYFLDSNYPERLKHCLDGPILFFKNGTINLEGRKIISVIGTRKVTSYGVSFCKRLIEELAPLNPIIVSGFAYGVDITAQRAAMENGLQTIGCLAHGLNKMYPKVHGKYVNKVKENGGFITEFWSDDAFDRNNFLKRNRVIAGMSEATIVIESAEKGGSLVTADIANSYNRDVFAVPGRAGDMQSIGCNNLIKSQKAHMLTGAADLIYLLNWELNTTNTPPRQTSLFVELSEQEQGLLNLMKDGIKRELDTLALEFKQSTSTVASLLLSLELKGVVRPLPGKLFERIM